MRSICTSSCCRSSDLMSRLRSHSIALLTLKGAQRQSDIRRIISEKYRSRLEIRALANGTSLPHTFQTLWLEQKPVGSHPSRSDEALPVPCPWDEQTSRHQRFQAGRKRCASRGNPLARGPVRENIMTYSKPCTRKSLGCQIPRWGVNSPKETTWIISRLKRRGHG